MRALLMMLTAAVLMTAGAVACTPNDQAVQAPPVTIVNTPPSDSGQTVLLTVVVLFLLAAAVAVAVLVMAWLSERRLRKQAQDTAVGLEYELVALTGQPVHRLRFTARQVASAMPQDMRPAIRSGAGGAP